MKRSECSTITTIVAPPPAGGLTAWLQVVCMRFVFFNTWGISNGSLSSNNFTQKNNHRPPLRYPGSESAQASLLFFLGVFAGRATDAGYFCVVYLAGASLQVLGFFMLFLCKNYWQIFLAQAVFMGLGNGLTFSPGRHDVLFFSRHHAVAVVGAATPVMLVSQIPGLTLFKPCFSTHTSSPAPLIDSTAFKEPSFMFFTPSMFLNFWGLYFAFFYMGTFARDRIGVPDTQNLILILNGVGVIGRIVPGLIGNRITGKLNILIPLSFASAIIICAWIAVDAVGGLYVFTVIYGFVGGAAQSLFPATATTMTQDIRRTGTRIVMILSFVGFATLTGPAIDGALIQRMGGRYTGAQVFAGSVIFLGACAAVAGGSERLRFKLYCVFCPWWK
ncbi:major facilitator superfamily domain-containing protein [Aspergillus granulosus]|uniref:Major facilitator superfamily domain-containing protein n=1 Tax=Aspergillus granulosus TaxID=176169 RepID=A0ABR4HE13_9EURO